jgi:D-sedoheptulose 7-phosphate isomerase
MQDQISGIIRSSIMTKQAILADPVLMEALEKTVQSCIAIFQNKQKMLICGNGGSAADAQHIAAEFTGKYLLQRPPLFAEALTVNTSYITAVANDYSYDEVFSRMVEAKGHRGDMLLALSTSGNSKNVLEAAKKAREMGMQVVGLTGINGGALAQYCDILLAVPEQKTPRIQESHILIGHIICELTEQALFPVSNG